MSDIVMPRLSDSMTEGTVVRWLKQPGDTVVRGEPIVEIETDKATITYEADVEGVIVQILIGEGETVPVGTRIAHLQDGAATSIGQAFGRSEQPPAPLATPTPPPLPTPPPAPLPMPQETGDFAAPDLPGADHPEFGQTGEQPAFQDTGEQPVPTFGGEPFDPNAVPYSDEPVPGAPLQQPADDAHDRVKASPIARRLARKLGVDLEQIAGTGPGGRIVKEDVEAAATAAAAPSGEGGPIHAPAPDTSIYETYEEPAFEAPPPLPADFGSTGEQEQVIQPQTTQEQPAFEPPAPQAPPIAPPPLPAPPQFPQEQFPQEQYPQQPQQPYPQQPYPQAPQPQMQPMPQQPMPQQPMPPGYPQQQQQQQPFPGPPPFVSGMTGGYPAVPPPAEQAPPQPQQPQPQQPQPQQPAGTATRGQATESVLTSAQQTVARRMAESKATAPEFFVETDVDMTNAVSYREQLKSTLNPVPSFNDFVIKASAQALRQYPKVNAAYKDGHFEQYSDVNIGVVVSAEELLAVPTLFNVDQKGLAQIALESHRLADAVRSRTIQPSQMSGGTFSISNLGMYGVDRFTAILNPPQAAILAVGAITRRAVIAEDGMSLVVRQIMTVTLTCDHRILYGAEAAEFLGAIKAWLESPQLLPV